jgi:branched-chain amino acid transport system substrate-binding protein
MKLRNLGVLGVVAVMGLAACNGTAATPGASASKGTLKIGIELPLSGGEVANGVPTKNGVLLAIQEANKAGGVGGYTIADNTQDDAVNGAHDPNQGAKNIGTLAADADVIGVVGPFNSSVARAEIPVSNEAGLAQCSPANTGVDLTQTGSEAYRPKNPNVRNYFRVATPDNIQGPAGGAYAYTDLGKKKAFVIDDTEAFGVGVADAFEGQFKKLGGTIVGRQGNDYKVNTDFTSILTAAKALGPDVVYFGGTQVTGGGQVRKQMGAAGMLDIPMVGPDGIADLGAGGGEGAFITLAGVENANNVHGTVAAIHDIPNAADFTAKYKAAFSADPGAYSGPAYACTQAILGALKNALAANPADKKAIREGVRADIFKGSEYATVLGTIHFDANGDTSQKFISFYKVDPAAEGGKGGWVFVKQQDFSQGGL